MLVRRPLRLRYSLYHSLVASVVVAWVRAVWASRCSCCSCCSMSFCTILFIMIRAFLAACGGERKKEICGDTPAKDSVLCTPGFVKEVFGFTSHPGKGFRPLHSWFCERSLWLYLTPRQRI